MATKTKAVRFHSTEVDTTQSLSEVAALLRKYGSTRFEQEWDGFGRTQGIRFNLPAPEAAEGYINVVLRPQTEVLADKLELEHRITDPDQVDRVAWRQLKGIMEGILLAADTGMFPAAQLFLGMAETPSGVSLWESIITGDGPRLLTPGDE